MGSRSRNTTNKAAKAVRELKKLRRGQVRFTAALEDIIREKASKMTVKDKNAARRARQGR